jgi:hypothetical protein
LPGRTDLPRTYWLGHIEKRRQIPKGSIGHVKLSGRLHNTSVESSRVRAMLPHLHRL